MNPIRYTLILLIILVNVHGYDAVYGIPEPPQIEVSRGAIERTITVEATAYCSCVKCCGKSDGITASGVKAQAGRTIAADTSLFPFGTRVRIDGHEYVVEDRGGAIKGYRIDIYFDSHTEALQFGRRKVEMEVLK